MPDPSELLTIAEARHLLRIGHTTIYKLLGSGELESIKIGGARRIPRAALDAFVQGLRSSDTEIVA